MNPYYVDSVDVCCNDIITTDTSSINYDAEFYHILFGEDYILHHWVLTFIGGIILPDGFVIKSKNLSPFRGREAEMVVGYLRKQKVRTSRYGGLL